MPLDTRFICGQYCNYASYFSPAATLRALRTRRSTATRWSQTRGNGRTKFDGWGVSGQADIDLNDSLQLQSITSYRDYTLHFTNDDDYIAAGARQRRGRPRPTGASRQELRLNGTS